MYTEISKPLLKKCPFIFSSDIFVKILNLFNKNSNKKTKTAKVYPYFCLRIYFLFLFFYFCVFISILPNTAPNLSPIVHTLHHHDDFANHMFLPNMPPAN